jgi:FkbM family methyltransferase
LDKRKSVIAEIDGITYDLDLTEYIDSSIYYRGCFEPETTALIARVVKPGMIALDIGANVGCHTFRLAQLVGASGRAVAFEPMQCAYTRLCRNAQLNSFGNLTLERIALGNTNGMLQAGFRTSWPLYLSSSVPETESVPVMRLDDYMRRRGIDRIDFIKLDVDGYEYRVLQGAHDALSRCAPMILMEFAAWTLERVGDKACEMLEYLETLDYELLVGNDFSKPVQSKEILLSATPAGISMNVFCRSKAVGV